MHCSNLEDFMLPVVVVSSHLSTRACIRIILECLNLLFLSSVLHFLPVSLFFVEITKFNSLGMLPCRPVKHILSPCWRAQVKKTK